LPYAEEETDSVYLYVPIDIANAIITNAGGIDILRTVGKWKGIQLQ